VNEAEMMVAILVPLTAILAIFVFLPWVILSHRAKMREGAARSAGDPAMNAELVALAEKLERRVSAIETILDSESPGWRKHR
jgi:phage shock protein B